MSDISGLELRIASQKKFLEALLHTKTKLKESKVQMAQVLTQIQDSEQELLLLKHEMLKLQLIRFRETGVPIDPEYQSLEPKKSQPQIKQQLSFKSLFRSFSDSLNSKSENHAKVSQDALTDFGFLRADSKYSQELVMFRLIQCRSRLIIEERVRKGIEKMMETIGSDEPLKLKDCEQKLRDCKSRLFLLEQGRKRYEPLVVGATPAPPVSSSSITINTSSPATSPIIPEDAIPVSKNRTVLYGKLKIRLLQAVGLQGIQNSKNSIFATISIDNQPRAKSKPTTSLTWNEDLTLSLEKANEIAIEIYESSASLSSSQNSLEPAMLDNLLGMVWFKISDFYQEAEMVANAKQHSSGSKSNLSASTTADSLAMAHSENSNENKDASSIPTTGFTPAAPQPFQPRQMNKSVGTEMGDITLDLIPQGRIVVSIKFTPELPKRKLQAPNSSSGLVRRQNVQKLTMVRGHKMSAFSSFHVLKCAVCSEFLVSGSGYRCIYCSFVIHTRCESKVIAPCISARSKLKSGNDDKSDDKKSSDDLLDIIKHKIPHRFVRAHGAGVGWCAHCGSMAMSLKSLNRCSECGILSHEQCQPCIPEFCKLPANILNHVREIAEMKKNAANNLAATSAQRLPTTTSVSSDLVVVNNSASTKNLSKIQSVLSFGDLVADDAAIEPIQRTSTAPPAIEKSNPPPINSAFAFATSNNSQPPSQRPSEVKMVPLTPPPMSMAATKANPTLQGSKEALPAPLASRPTNSSTKHFKNGVKSEGGSRDLSKSVGLDDFTFLAVLGKGNFGKVMLTREKCTGTHYAIKVLKKEFILEHNEVESTKSEKRCFLVATKNNHPFLVNLHSCFQTESRLYFVMEFVSGGDLMWHIQRGKFTPKQTIFYAREVLLALEYWHINNIVYRDLKLDNILLTLDGHIKIADYGLCKENMRYNSTTTTFCGTPEFMAPEILSEKPYGRAVDWWALGVLIYEMLLGRAPFAGETEDQIFRAILSNRPSFPSSMQKEAADIVEQLLCKDPTKRLGSGKGDAQEIKEHAYFLGTNWDDVFNRRIPAPYLPNVDGPTDLSNFDSEFTSEEPVLTPVHSVLTVSNQEEFRGFTHVSDWAVESRKAAMSL